MKKYTSAEWKILSDTYRMADRTTAYWTKEKYNEAECKRAWAHWFSVIDSFNKRLK